MEAFEASSFLKHACFHQPISRVRRLARDEYAPPPSQLFFRGTFQKALFASRNAFIQYLYSCHTFYTRDLPVER